MLNNTIVHESPTSQAILCDEGTFEAMTSQMSATIIELNDYRQQVYSQAESNSDDPEQWPVLDHSALYDTLVEEIVEATCENSEADPMAVAMTFLARFSVQIGRTVKINDRYEHYPYLRISDKRIYPNEFVAVVGDTATARKGTSADSTERAFEHFDTRTSPGPLSSGEGLIYSVRDSALSWEVDRKTKAGQWILTDPGVDDKRLFILTEELSSAFVAMRREGNSLSSVLRCIFDGKKLEPITKNNRLSASCSHIGVLGHITGRELATVMQDSEFFNGLANRFVWICCRMPKLVSRPKPISDFKMKSIVDDLNHVTQAVSRIKEMSLTEESWEMWDSVYPELMTQGSSHILNAVTARAHVHVLKFSMQHALLDCSEWIEPIHIETAIKLWQYSNRSARFIFQSKMNSDPLQFKIMAALKLKEMSASEIYKHFQNNISSEKIKAALKELLEIGKVDSRIVKTSKRDKTIYFLKAERI